MFSAICHLIAPEFDEQSLRLYVVQSFGNALMGSDEDALHCLEKHLTNETIQIQTMVAGWQQYLINMEMPYEKGVVEGTSFFFQWTSIIFNVNIQIWSFTNKTIVNYYPSKTNCNRPYNILSFKTSTSHIHYEPLLLNQNTNQSNPQHRIVQMHANTKNRISFRKLKQMICTNSIDKIRENRNRKKKINCLLRKSTPIEIYKKHIDDTPKTKCPICSKLQF